MSDALSGPRSEADWAQVLERIEHTLGHSLALADPAAEGKQSAAPDQSAAEGNPLQVLDDRLSSLRATLGRAETDAADAESVTVQVSRDAEEWVGSVQAVGRMLAEWAARAV